MAQPPTPTGGAQQEDRVRLASQESLLLDYLQKLEKHRKGRMAAHVHLSRLQEENRRDQHVKIASNSFEGMVRMLQGQLFILRNKDMIFVFKAGQSDDVRAAVVKLRFMFADDPLIADDDGDTEEDGFVTWYDLENDYDAVIRMAESLLAEQKRAETRTNATTGGAALEQGPRKPQGDPLTPAVLGRMEHGLARADLSNLVRRQSVCVIVGRSPPQRLFSEVFVSIGDLRQTLAPNVDLGFSPWLFQHLTSTLDSRVLSMLARNDDASLGGEISINLNVSTILSEDFLKFDDSIKASMRGTIVLEVNKTDIFADLGAWEFAREFARERAYRLCIDGIGPDVLPYISRAKLGADLIKLNWDPVMADWGETTDAPMVKNLRRQGVGKVILCRCDTQEAIDVGQALGITMFQGRHVENLAYAEDQRQEQARAKSVMRKPKKKPAAKT